MWLTALRTVKYRPNLYIGDYFYGLLFRLDDANAAGRPVRCALPLAADAENYYGRTYWCGKEKPIALLLSSALAVLNLPSHHWCAETREAETTLGAFMALLKATAIGTA